MLEEILLAGALECRTMTYRNFDDEKCEAGSGQTNQYHPSQ